MHEHANGGRRVVARSEAVIPIGADIPTATATACTGAAR